MQKINVFLKQNAKSKEGTIGVNFYIDRQRVQWSLRIPCNARNWDEKRMRVKASDPIGKDKNLIIDRTLARINDVLVKYRLRDKKLTRELFLKAYNRPSDFDNFFLYVKSYTDRIKNTLDFNTLKLYKSVFKKLNEYSETLSFDEITPEFLNNYFFYLKKRLGNSDSTANKNLAVIKKFVSAAVREGYMELNPFQHFKIRHAKPKVLYLTEDELKRLVEFYHTATLLPIERQSLQIFLFMCFGSQHIGDAKQMTIEQLKNDIFTYYRMKLANRKPEPVNVPISKSLRAIIDDVAQGREKGLLFAKFPSDQKINLHLKHIAAMADIDKPISCKTGRHTFATFYLSKTQDINSLKDILGHSNISQTLAYAHVLESDKQRGIACFDVFG